MAECGDESSRTPPRWGYGAERLPATLDELDGPKVGQVELPLHLAWSGLLVFDVGDLKLLLGLYRIVLNNGLRDDFSKYLDGELLVRHWPILRQMVGRGVRGTWEERFPELRPPAAVWQCRMPDCHRLDTHGEGPRGTESAGPFGVSTDVRAAPVPGERRRGVRRWFWGPPVGAPAHWGRAGGVDQWRCGMNLVAHGGTWAVLASCGMGDRVRNRYDRFCADSVGRPRASPEPTVLLGDRAAVPCRPVTTLERGPTTHGTIRTSHHSSEATRGSFGPAPG